jgi:hypothetical protein
MLRYQSSIQACTYTHTYRGDLMRQRSYVVNRYRYINTIRRKFKAGESQPLPPHMMRSHTT